MPLIYGRNHPESIRQAHRISNIPRPTIQPVVKNSGISHASKPSVNTVPLTPAKRLSNHQKVTQRGTQKNIPPPESNPEVAILELIPFGRQPIVDFGHVQVNQTQLKHVGLRNLQNSQQQLYVKTFPKADKCFYIDATQFLIAPKTEIFVTLAWTPKTSGTVRETITFRDINGMPLKIMLVGTAVLSRPGTGQKKNIQTSCFRSGSSRFSPTKFKTYKTSTNHAPVQKQLTRLIYASRRRQSAQIVRKMLSQHDEVMAIKIQSHWRLVLAKQQLDQLRIRQQAVLKIQTYMRMILGERHLRKLQVYAQSAKTIQSFFRSLMIRKQFCSMKVATIVIQSVWRQLLAKRELEALKAKRDATIKIQSFTRMILARRQLIDLKARQAAVIKVQSYTRMILVRQQLKLSKIEHDAAIIIQTFWRGSIIRKRYVDKRNNIIVLQSFCRRFLAVKASSALRCNRDAAIKIQSYIRMILAKQKLKSLILKSKSASIIQAHWKGYVARKRYNFTRDAIVILQTYWRCRNARKQLNQLRAIHRVTLGLQSLCRGYLVRTRLRFSIEALIRIQNRSSKRQVNLIGFSSF